MRLEAAETEMGKRQLAETPTAKTAPDPPPTEGKGYSRDEMLEYAGHAIMFDRLDIAIRNLHSEPTKVLKPLEEARAAHVAACGAILDGPKSHL